MQVYLPLGWNIFDTNRTVGGLLGYSSVNSTVSLNVPGTEKHTNTLVDKDRILTTPVAFKNELLRQGKRFYERLDKESANKVMFVN